MGPKLIITLKRLKAGQEIREDGPETHLVKSGTPTMGGLLILISIVVSVLFWQDLNNLYTWIALLTIVGFGLVGFADDYLKITKRNTEGLRAGFKIIAQIVLAAIVVIILYINKNDQTTLLYFPFLNILYLTYPFLHSLRNTTSGWYF